MREPTRRRPGDRSADFAPLDLARFWSFVDRRGADDCWEWRGGRDGDGYGMFWFNGRGHRATRVSLAVSGAPVSPGHLVRHACDNPPCVNPAHLSTGTHQDNVDDSITRGRWAHGERAGRAKLTESQVREIRERVDAGESQRRLAAAYGVSKASIYYIGRRLNWRHVA